MIDYTICYKARLPIDQQWADSWDVFVSAFNSSERVKRVYEKVAATTKHWLVHHEYGYDATEYPQGEVFAPPPGDEAEFLAAYFDRVGPQLGGARICVDTTGFMRPHLMLLLRYLDQHHVKRFDALYSEPDHYVKQEKTEFAGLPVINVRPVLGYEGTHSTDTSNDVLVIGAGYDNALISHAAENKKSARKVQLFGLPSLRPDMYQENILRARQAAESTGSGGLSDVDHHFAPANDPFVVASVLQSIVQMEAQRRPITNLYLCPLATKPQALGFALYYLAERQSSATSMIFPFATSYSRETTSGLSRVWRYTVELP